MEHRPDDLVVALKDGDRVPLIEDRLARAAGVDIRREGAFEIIGDAEVVDDQAARLVLEDPVNAGDRLDRAYVPSSACPRTSCAAAARRSR